MVADIGDLCYSQGPPQPPPPGLLRPPHGRTHLLRAELSDTLSQLPPSAPQSGHVNKKGKKKKKWPVEKSSKVITLSTLPIDV